MKKLLLLLALPLALTSCGNQTWKYDANKIIIYAGNEMIAGYDNYYGNNLCYITYGDSQINVSCKHERKFYSNVSYVIYYNYWD